MSDVGRRLVMADSVGGLSAVKEIAEMYVSELRTALDNTEMPYDETCIYRGMSKGVQVLIARIEGVCERERKQLTPIAQ